MDLGERALPEEKTLTGLKPSIEVLFVQKSLSLPSDQRRTKINLLCALERSHEWRGHFPLFGSIRPLHGHSTGKIVILPKVSYELVGVGSFGTFRCG